MGWLRKRFSEPSTKNGLALVLTIAAELSPTYAPILYGLATVLAGRAASQPG